jgi:hypothetical protein
VEFVVKNTAYYEHNLTGMFTDQRLDIILEHLRRSSNVRFRTKRAQDASNLNGNQIIEVY